MRLKTAFIIGATFCFVPLVCTSPVASRGEPEELLKPDKSNPLMKTLNELMREIVIATFTSLFLTCDTFASSSNTHCMTAFWPNFTLEHDRRNHVIAQSFAELWKDLRTMESVLNVYTEVLEKFSNSNHNDITTWFEGLDKAMVEDPHLAQRYKELKSKYEKLVVLESDHLERERLISWPDDRIKVLEKNTHFKELYLNFIFNEILNTSYDKTNENNTEELEFRALGKSMVEMSQSEDNYVKLQLIYKESLAEMSANVEVRKFLNVDATKGLFRKLKQKIAANPLLNAEFEKKYEEMLKN